MLSRDMRLPIPFRRLALSNLAAQCAEQIGLAAAPLVAVLALGASVGEISLLQVAQTVPYLLFSIPAGMLVDRSSRRGLMVASEAARVLALVAVVLLVVLNALSIPTLIALSALATLGTVVFSVAAPALVPILVPGQSLTAANVQLGIVRSGAFIVGPALAGLLVGWLGASPTYALAAALSLAAVVLLARVPEPARAPEDRKVSSAPLADVVEGARFAWSHRYLRAILLTAVIWNLSWMILQSVYVPYAVHTLHLAAAGVGATQASMGAGMVTGALLTPTLARRWSFGATLALGPAASVLAGMAVAATLWLPSAFLLATAFFLFGAGPTIWTITQTTLRQTVAPVSLLGRVSAVFMTVNTGARPLGAAIGGLVAIHFGLIACILLSAVGYLGQGLVIALSGMPRLARLSDAVDVTSRNAAVTGGEP